jgi:hypothetical protein
MPLRGYGAAKFALNFFASCLAKGEINKDRIVMQSGKHEALNTS